MFDLRNNLFTLCANHVANENLFFSTSHFPFLLFLCLTVSLNSFILAFTESVRQNKQTITHTKKNAVKQHTKITGFTFSYLSPMMSFFNKSPSFSSKLFCFCFLRFYPKENKKENNSEKKKRNFSVEWLRWRKVKDIVGNSVGSSNQGKKTVVCGNYKSQLRFIWWFWSVKSYASLYFC